MSRGLTRLVVVWPWVLALLVCAPLLAPGYVLTYDMVWVPDLALRADTVGLGSALPRAVPSDAVVAVLDEVVPGQVLQKVMLVGVLGVAGAGMARLWEPTMPVGALASSTLFVWNPFVAERLVLGHWPLLVAYAALPWLLSGARQLRREDSGGRSRVGAALLVMSMTPATGLMGMLAALCCGVDVRRGGRGRRVASLVAVGVAANATWICAGLANLAASRSDSNAGGLFGARAEGYLGTFGSLATLGGVWNADVVPVSRTTILGAVGALLLVLVMAVGAAGHGRRLAVPGVYLLALAGLVVASSGWLVPDAVGRVADQVPGGGLLRDGTRFLALVAPLEALLFGAGVQAVCSWANTRSLSWVLSFGAVSGMLLPVAVLPDLAWGAAGRLAPVHYPSSWHQARDIVAASPTRGDVLVLPFSAYRAPAWNDHRPVLDPAGRFFDRTTLVNDDLVVADEVIEGEDPRAARIGALLAEEADVDALGAAGIGIVVESAPEAGTSVGDEVLVADEITVRAIAGADAPDPPRLLVLTLVCLGWLTSMATVLVAGFMFTRARRLPGHTAVPRAE
jgi:hypothetical protein